MPTTPFIIPGKPFADNFRQFTAELRSTFAEALKNGRAGFPIKRVFELFPLNVIEASVGEQLIGRGDIEVASDSSSSGKFENRGEWIIIDFGDDVAGLITIEFDEIFSGMFSWREDGHVLQLDFLPTVKVVMAKLPDEWGIRSNQRLIQIVLRRDKVDYLFRSETDPPEDTLLQVDLTLDPPEDDGITPRALNRSRTLVLDDEGGQLIACGIAACVWCATQGDEDNPDETPEVPPPRDTDYVLFVDCVSAIADVYRGHLRSDPFWETHEEVLKGNKTARLNFAFDNCIPPVPPTIQPLGSYKIRITTIQVDITLPLKVMVSGPVIL